jgi:hypothetical protein
MQQDAHVWVSQHDQHVWSYINWFLNNSEIVS